MKIEVLYFDGCPNHEALVPRLRELLDRVGIDEEIRLRAVESFEAAERERFLGSPTLRIDSRDVEPGAAARSDFGLKCRLYRTEAGTGGLPPDEWVLDALGTAESNRSARAGVTGEVGETMTDIETLATSLAGAVPEMGERDQRLALALLRALAKGEPVAPATLARTSDVSEVDIKAAFERWLGVFYDDQQRVIGFGGLTLSATSHRIALDGHRLWTWCAWDTLFLPELIGHNARVRSTCPVTGEEVTLTVGAHGVRDLHPPRAVVSFLISDKPLDANIIQSFCHFVHFFSSRQAGKQWTARHEGTVLVSVDDAYELGRRTNRAWFADALRDRSDAHAY